MEPIVRGVAVYLILLLVFRIAGKRTLAETSSFDLVLLLIISETTQEAMVDSDHSMTNCLVLVVTLIGLNIIFSEIKQHSKIADKWMDDVPTVIVKNGEPLRDRMARLRIDEGEVLAAARLTQGLERMDQIKYAVAEREGDISVVPK